jgi:hypothetical protein
MNSFFTRNAGMIVAVVISLSVGGFSDSVLDRIFPVAGEITRELYKEITIEAFKDDAVKSVLVAIVREENAPMKADIKQIKEQNQIFTDDMAEDWVRVMKKQYLKVQTNRNDLSWDDVQFALAKWPILPVVWKNPELEAMIEYLEIKYDDHINNGGAS